MTRRIAHLSDLHFGRDRPELIDSLLAAVEALGPDLVAISGDLTQRARTRQFRAARAFIDRLAAPVLVVPGNHDVPLDAPLRRMLLPFAGYRRHIDRELEPRFDDSEIAVLGVNTVNPFAWQRGKFRDRAVARVCAAFAATERARTRVAVLHHPLVHEPGDEKTLMRHARRSVARLAACGTDIVLSGHLHSSRAVAFTAEEGGHGCLLIQAGTGLSTRQRGEPNDFNLLSIGAGRVEVERHAVQTGTAFTPVARASFARRTQVWQSIAASPPAAGDG